MECTRHIELDIPYDDAISRVKDALKDQGFGILTANGRTVIDALRIA